MGVSRAEISSLPAPQERALRRMFWAASRLALALGSLAILLALLAPASFASTTLVKDINPGSGSSYPADFTTFAGRLYFQANDGIHGTELWASDGTAAGTTLIKDINPGSAGSFPGGLTIADSLGRSVFYFSANDGTHGTELWAYGGGTALVSDINPGSGSSSPDNLTTVNGTLYFTADDGTHGSELWTSDGTAAGTTPVSDLASEPSWLTDVNGTLYFTAYYPSYGYELWTVDATTGAARMVMDINPGSASSNPRDLTNVNGTLYFVADDGTHGPELWKSNGTAATTTLVKDINIGGGGSDPSDLTNVNGRLYFSANNGAGYQIWTSDGTLAGTRRVDEGLYSGSPLGWFTNVNGTLFFVADAIDGQELWKSDGTTSETQLVKDINPGSGSSDPAYLTNVNGTLYFTANDGTHGTELWTSDGTAAGTIMVSDINPGSGNSDPASLTNVNGTLYFDANDGTHGGELWSFRPTLTVARNGGGSGTVTSSTGEIDCGSACSRDYVIADTVTLEATPGSNSTFTGWSGACSGTEPTCTVQMNADRAVTATFAPIPHVLSVSRTGSGTGVITSSPSGIDCGSTCVQSFAGRVTLQATSGSNSSFSGWSGGGCSGTGSCTVTMDSDQAVTATFTANRTRQQTPLVSLTGIKLSARKIATAGHWIKRRCVKATKHNNGSAHCRLAIRLQITYTLNIPARVKITLKQQAPGRRVAGKCVKPTNRDHKHKKCVRWMNVNGSLNETGTAGRNSFTWNGRIGARNLPSGTYTLTATPTANGRMGTPRQITFKILG